MINKICSIILWIIFFTSILSASPHLLQYNSLEIRNYSIKDLTINKNTTSPNGPFTLLTTLSGCMPAKENFTKIVVQRPNGGYTVRLLPNTANSTDSPYVSITLPKHKTQLSLWPCSNNSTVKGENDINAGYIMYKAYMANKDSRWVTCVLTKDSDQYNAVIRVYDHD
jgi:hypothetical protein